MHDGRSQDRTGIDYVMVYIHPKLFMELAGLKEIVKFSSLIVYNRILKQGILNLVQAVFAHKDESLCYELLAVLADHFPKLK
ncbi:hypothetical protein HMSSN036_11870 [Paenibacillus macerans]|nr:hypothetical protein HMSSN036_11870 [Paenibacillus macerans]